MSAQGWSAATTLGQIPNCDITLKALGMRGMNPFRVLRISYDIPRVVATLQPWADISERLRRIGSNSQCHLDGFAWYDNAPALSFNFNTGNSLGSLDQNALHLLWREFRICLKHARDNR